jgi:hypothetical protein
VFVCKVIKKEKERNSVLISMAVIKTQLNNAQNYTHSVRHVVINSSIH